MSRDALVNLLYNGDNEISDDLIVEILGMYDEQRKEVVAELLEELRRF